jgi:hypothetical protein
MATNNPRHGYERKRSQIKTKTMGQKHWTKRRFRAPAMASRRVSSGRTDSVGNGIYQGRLVAQFD